MASIAKKCNPNVIVTQGGPNFPHEEKLQGGFLAQRPYTDIYTILEGEKSCTNVVKEFWIAKKYEQIFASSIDGCVFIDPKTKIQKILNL